MSAVEQLAEEILKFTPGERQKLDILIGNGFEGDEWDRQMKVDGAAGKFDAMAAKALADAKAGRAKPWP